MKRVSSFFSNVEFDDRRGYIDDSIRFGVGGGREGIFTGCI